MPFRAPDGASLPINNLTIQSFNIPAYATVLLWGWANASWEQAVVIGVDGVRQPQQLGSYDRPGFISIGPVDHPRTLTLAGWHKRSGPDGSQPWHASRGKTLGDVAGWDDSGGDQDFDDFRVRVGMVKPVLSPLVRATKLIKLDFLPVESLITKDELETV